MLKKQLFVESPLEYTTVCVLLPHVSIVALVHLIVFQLLYFTMDANEHQSRKGKKHGQSVSKRKSIASRKVQNRYVQEQDAESVGTSSKKLRLSKDDYEIPFDASFGYRMISFTSIFSVLSEVLVCCTCHKRVNFTEASKQGLGFKLVVSCDECAPVYIDSCPKINNKAYEINQRMIFAMRLLGIGINGIRKFCAFMDLPHPVYQKSYKIIIDAIHESVQSICSMKTAAKEEKKITMEKGENRGITVSGDGSWRRRGFSSLYGIFSLIAWYTGKVVDIDVRSKFCKACSFWKSKEDTAEYNDWKKDYEAKCEANHEGSAGKMEVDSATAMFARAQEINDVKYINYVGDGDCKTFKAILENNPDVTKKECIDHVQKRMGSRLRKLVKKHKGLSGRYKLTGKLIDELSIYYGLAIRRNSNSTKEMKEAIWATLYHKLSSNKKPQHHLCPEGLKSWCSWQAEKAKGTNMKDFQHDPPMSKEIFEAIKPEYEELSREELLIRCLGGFTQNSNESLNSLVWSMTPKNISSGKTVLDVADVAIFSCSLFQ